MEKMEDLNESIPDTQTQKEEDFNSQSLLLTPDIVGNMPWGRLFSLIPGLETVDLAAPKINLGRDPNCDITITKEKLPSNQLINISKKHLSLTRDDSNGLIILNDLSKNGTFINGILVGKGKNRVIQHDDIIAVGHKSLKVYILKLLRTNDEDDLPPDLKEKYVPGRLLGQGACGQVRQLYEKTTCKSFALKKIRLGKYATSSIDHLNHPLKIQTEIKILRSLSHPFIISMYDIVETPDDVFIVLEYMAGGELTNRIRSTKRPLTEQQCKFIFYQIVLGVQFLHENDIIHRDLKPENVLLLTNDQEPLIKITDFGLSKILKDETFLRTTCGTPYYVAPEVINDNYDSYSHKVDIWSIGVILFYMLSQTLPFTGDQRNDLNTKIMSGLINWNSPRWRFISNDAKDLVLKMLIVNPIERININDIFKHPWIEKDMKVQFQINRLINNVLSEDDAPQIKKARYDDAQEQQCTIYINVPY